MSTLFGGGDPSGGRLIQGEEDLTAFFRSGEKSPDRLGIGIEYERLPVDRLTGHAIPYAAPQSGAAKQRSTAPSVERFLQHLARAAGWSPLTENGRIIALERGGSHVTLEPGAQVELSGRIHATTLAAREEILDFVRDADASAAATGFAFLGMGSQPFTEFSDIGWVPKERYGIMAPWLARRGHLAHGMMKATAGCQFNLDFLSEADAMEMLRVAMAVSPIITALCARSPLARGQACGFLSRRAHIWMHTDPDRCGLLALALREGARYADYVAWALDVPMLFVVRDGKWIEMTGRTFRNFLGGDNRGLTPTRADWEMHLTTLFPEVRLKQYIEIRGADSAPPDAVVAIAAFWQGLLYNAGARRRALVIAGTHSLDQWIAFQKESARHGLRARINGIAALELAQGLIEAANGGLNPEEQPLLSPLRQIAFTDRATPSERMLQDWVGVWRRDPALLIASHGSSRGSPC